MKPSVRFVLSILWVHMLVGSVFAKDSPAIVMYWPNQATPSLKVTFGKLREVAIFGGKFTLLSEVTVQNVSGKPIPRASFTVHMLDKKNIRIGDGILLFDDLAPNETSKVQFQCETVGTPVTLKLVAHRDADGIPVATKIVPLKIISVPAGAKLTVDGEDEGITPATVNMKVGTRQLTLAKDGFAPASTPVEIKPDEMPGGSITIELGGLSLDIIELRDGTIVSGDAISLTLTEVVVRVDGKETKYDRNQVKKISLVERVTTEQPPVIEPVNAKEQR